MTGRYKSLIDGSIYNVYQKGFDLYAMCVEAQHKPTNKPFPIQERHLQTYLKVPTWVLIETPNLTNQ